MIKVCHIVNLITGRADGVYAHLKMIFENYDKTNFQHFLIFQGGEKIEREISDLGVKVFVSESLKKKISIKAFFDISKVLKSNDIQIIHTHLVKPYIISGLLNIFLRKKFIFNYHGLFLINNVYNTLIEKLVYRCMHVLINIIGRVDVVLVPSKKSGELLMQETKLFPEPITYYNGTKFKLSSSVINSELYNWIENIKTEKKLIALIGRLEFDKRIDMAIELIRNITLVKKNVCLLIFGEGRLEDNLKTLIQKSGLDDQIKFMGYVKDIVNYYNLFDVVLFTSEWEGMPLTMWEAMANKVPVIAPDVGGFKEILEENNCGLIYDPHNLNYAEEKILSVLNDEKLSKTLGENGRTAIEKKFNEKKFIEQIEQVYFNLLGR